MPKPRINSGKPNPQLAKCPTGIHGLDEITLGGLPRGRTSLVCGATGCGKTLLAMEFLYRGATEFGEPGVFMSFEEREKDLAENFASLGFDLDSLIKRDKLFVDFVRIEPGEHQEVGAYDLEGLFVRLGAAVDAVGAKRVVLDTIEALFSGFKDEAMLRAELRRLFNWLKDRGLTAIVTGEKGEKLLTRNGLEEYVADCVIYLDHRTVEQVATRRLKVIKYRGSMHGTNEFPFLVTAEGISIFPMTSMGLTAGVSPRRLSSGIPGLDKMLAGKGYYQGSTILVSGSAGSGKTSFGAHLADSVCRAGRRALYLAFEESEPQLARNMKSIGLDLQKWLDKGLLKVVSNRASLCNLEMHLVLAHKAVKEFKPELVIIDPISTLSAHGDAYGAKEMLARLLESMKTSGITVLATDLTVMDENMESTEVGISSICDTWIRLSMERQGHERQRRITIVKSRGMAHDYATKELLMTGKGMAIGDIRGNGEGK